jgi:hypothetical protein
VIVCPPWLCRFLTPDWLAAIGTVGATVLALILALREEITKLFVHPKLELDASIRAPSVQKTKWRHNGTDLGDVWYFRLAITNKGNAVARDVQVFLASVEQLTDGKFVPVKRFSPMFLKWAHVGAVTTPALWPEMPRFCDLVHITDPTYRRSLREDLPGVNPLYGVLALDLEVLPNQQGHLLEAGTYQFTFKLAASNCSARTEKRRVEFSGLWFPDEEAMFKQISITQ